MPSLIEHGYKPKRNVPPKSSISFCSGNRSIIGYGVAGSNSAECTPSRPNTFLENSTVASCIPKQIPKNGTLFSLAYLIALILPSLARKPNPPGTKIPSTSARYSAAFSSVTSLESIHLMSISLAKGYPACFNDSTTDKYASCKLTYLPTKPIVILPSKLLTISNNCFHSSSCVSYFAFNCKRLITISSIFCWLNCNGISYKESASRHSITLSLLMSQNNAILSFKSCVISYSVLTTIKSG
ncbi:Uncharacterised protein [Staphylococcus aureus]|nr:Uncharacterised protein [Staphylococcus aureus]